MDTTSTRQEALKKYFSPNIDKPISPSDTSSSSSLIMGGVGAVCLLLAMTGLMGGTSWLIGLIGVGLIWAAWSGASSRSSKARSDNSYYQNQMEKYEKYEPKPSDEQVDEWLNIDKAKLISGAVDKLGLVEEQILNSADPLIIIGPVPRARYKKGKDGVIRFSDYRVVVIYLSDYHLGAYSSNLDFINEKTDRELTQEYHYTDIVSVSTLSTNSDFVLVDIDADEKTIPDQQEFTLSVSSGEKISVTVAFPEVEILDGKLLPTGADKAIGTIRTMLREKKRSA